MADKPTAFSAFTFNDIDTPEVVAATTSAAALVLDLGGRGHLGASDIVRASEALHTSIGRLTGDQALALTISGFDNDPRELWQIRDVVTFLRRVMRHAGINDHHHPAVRMFTEPTIAVLVACGVFGNDHPYKVSHVETNNDPFKRYHQAEPGKAKLGPDYTYPMGDKQQPFDRGGLASGVVAIPDKRLVVMQFGTELTWLAASPTEAQGMAAAFRTLVEKHWGKLSYNVEELPIQVFPNHEKRIIEITMPKLVGTLAANPEFYLAWAQRLDEAVKAMEKYRA